MPFGFSRKSKKKHKHIDDNTLGRLETKRVIETIKQIGLRHGEESGETHFSDLSSDVRLLVRLMRRHRDVKDIQRISCHSLSNIAIHQDKCIVICSNNGHRAIFQALMDNICDWKICWLAMSAIWNIARPEICRKQFDVSAMKNIYKIMALHNDVKRKNEHTHLVIETSLGALSNLVLNDKLRAQCGRHHIIQFLLRVIIENNEHVNVATASAGLITNLAHSNDIASRLTDTGAVKLVVEMMTAHGNEIHLQRNCCAALSNISSSSRYMRHLIECLGVERLFASLNLATVHTSTMIEPLAQQALSAIDIEWSQVRMNSIHIAAKMGMHRSMYRCLQLMYNENDDEDSHGLVNNVNALDSNGNTALHYALRHGHGKSIRLLVSRGADMDIRDISGQSPQDLALEWGNTVVKGMAMLSKAKALMRKTMIGCCCHGPYALPKDIVFIIVDFVDAFAIMQRFGEDEFSSKCTSKKQRLTSFFKPNTQ